MKNVSKSMIEFPVEDRSWIALQERVIGLTNKLVEDLTYRELQSLRLDLSEVEQATLKVYQRTKRLEDSEAFAGIPSCRNWAEKLCKQNLEDLVNFQDSLRAVIIRLRILHDEGQLNAVWSDLQNFLDKFPGAEAKPDDGETWSQYTLIICNIGRVPPTDEGIGFSGVSTAAVRRITGRCLFHENQSQ